MELSQKLISVIDGIVHDTQGREFYVVQQLKNTSEQADNEQDKQVLALLSKVLSISYVTDEDKFMPLVVFADGSRSFAAEDITQDDILILRSVLKAVDSAWVHAKLAHILWVQTNEPEFVEIAVASYIELFWSTFHPQKWVDCYRNIQIAYKISSQAKKSPLTRRQVYDAIKCALGKLNGDDPLFLSVNLIKLIRNDIRRDDSYLIQEYSEKLVNKNIGISNDNYHLAHETYETLLPVYKKYLGEERSISLKVIYASYCEHIAMKRAEEGDTFRAINLMKRSCRLYNETKHSNYGNAHDKLASLQQQSLEQMKPFSYSLDLTNLNKEIKQVFQGLSIQESIIQLGRISTIYRIDETKLKLNDESNNYVFSSLLGSSQLNEYGQVVENLPPLGSDIAKLDPKILYKHMVRCVSDERDCCESITLRIALGYMQCEGMVTLDDLDFLVVDNPIIPENRASIIKEGLYLGLTGKLNIAMHILLPQTEHIFRQLVRMCGDTITFLCEDGTEEFKPLSTLFKSEIFNDAYDENVIFTFQSLIDDPAGYNLRNLVAHGLFEPHDGNDAKSLCFLCLLIKFLSWYKTETLDIIEKLACRDRERKSKC